MAAIIGQTSGANFRFECRNRTGFCVCAIRDADLSGSKVPSAVAFANALVVNDAAEGFNHESILRNRDTVRKSAWCEDQWIIYHRVSLIVSDGAEYAQLSVWGTALNTDINACIPKRAIVIHSSSVAIDVSRAEECEIQRGFLEKNMARCGCRNVT